MKFLDALAYGSIGLGDRLKCRDKAWYRLQKHRCDEMHKIMTELQCSSLKGTPTPKKLPFAVEPTNA